MLKNTCKNKMQAKKLRSILQMLRKLSLDELEMNIDEMELWAEEMMDVVESDNMEEQMEDEDSSTMDNGDNVDVMDVVDGDNVKAGVIPKVIQRGDVKVKTTVANQNIYFYKTSIQPQSAWGRMYRTRVLAWRLA